MPHLANSGAKAFSGSRPVLVQAPEGMCCPSASWRASKMAAMQGISGPWSWSAAMPSPAAGLGLGIKATDSHHHAAQWRAQGVEQPAASVHERCQLFWLLEPAPLVQPGQYAEGALRQAHFQRRPKAHALRDLVMGGEQLQVGDVTHRAPAGAQALERHWHGISPSQARLPAPVFPHGNRYASVAQHCGQRGFSSRGALCRGDAGVDRMDAAPAATQGIHHG